MEINSLWEELLFELGVLLKTEKINGEEIIPGSGNRKGKILFIGDDPNLYINEKLGVISGTSGEFLIKLCDTLGLEPEDYYITTLTKCHLKYKDFFEEKQEKLRELLHMQIALINPEIVVFFGEKSAEITLEREINFKRERGVIKELAGDMEYIITYDPIYAKKSRESDGKSAVIAKDFWNDLKLVERKLKIDV